MCVLFGGGVCVGCILLPCNAAMRTHLNPFFLQHLQHCIPSSVLRGVQLLQPP